MCSAPSAQMASGHLYVSLAAFPLSIVLSSTPGPPRLTVTTQLAKRCADSEPNSRVRSTQLLAPVRLARCERSVGGRTALHFAPAAHRWASTREQPVQQAPPASPRPG